MNEKTKKAVCASVWAAFMMVACYLTISIIPMSANSALSTEASMLLAAEIGLLAISLTILTIVLRLRKQMFEPLTTSQNINMPKLKVPKIKKAIMATFLTILVATSAYAAVWMLTVKVPVLYKEPLAIWFSDETALPTWYPLHQHFGSNFTTPPVNLTNGAFDVYVNATNNGRRNVLLTVNITAYNITTSEITALIGFNVTGDGINLESWGSVEFGVLVHAGETVSGTITYLLSNNSPLGTGALTDLQIVWRLSRSEPSG